MTVLVSEILVDWLKHAFITKFNHIRPSVYERYIDVLCRDLTSASAVGRRGPRKVTYSSVKPLNHIHFGKHKALLRGSVAFSRTTSRLCCSSYGSFMCHYWSTMPGSHTCHKF